MNAPETLPTQMIALADYEEHPKNYNKHPEEQLVMLEASLAQFGQPQPLTVWQKYILTGNGLTMAARRAGYSHLEAKVCPDSWTYEKAIAWMVAHNEHAKQSNPDEIALGNILRLLAEAGGESNPTDLPSLGVTGKTARSAVREALRDAGLDNTLGEDPGGQEERAAMLKEKWGVEYGDLWQLDGHRLLVGDCLVPEQVARVLAGDKVNQLLTDPPYGVDYSAKNVWLNEFGKGNRIETPILGDTEIEIGTYLSFFADFLRVASPHMAAYNVCHIFMAGQELHNLRGALDLAGWTWSDYLIWDKRAQILSRKDYQSTHEFVLYGWKGKHQFHGAYPSTVLRMWDKSATDMTEDELRALLVAIENASAIIPWPRNNKNAWHPTEKPVGLLERLISDGTEVPGAVVYDPFVGSGSTVIACERLGRRCRGIDRSPGWVASAIERWHLVTGKEPVCER